MTLQSATLTTTSGGTVTFRGAVTNNSGLDLNASDFLFVFFGSDPSVLATQDLGLSSDFAIPNTTTSPIVALFDVTVPAVQSGTFPVDFQLQDPNLEFSTRQTVSVAIEGVVSNPEPASSLLLLAGLCVFAAVRRRGNCSRS